MKRELNAPDYQWECGTIRSAPDSAGGAVFDRPADYFVKIPSQSLRPDRSGRRASWVRLKPYLPIVSRIQTGLITDHWLLRR